MQYSVHYSKETIKLNISCQIRSLSLRQQKVHICSAYLSLAFVGGGIFRILRSSRPGKKALFFTPNIIFPSDGLTTLR
jgi:hypothetical protein